MTDDPDGDRSDGPSDGTSEEDPFVYPLADDDAEESPEDEESTDEASQSGGESSTSGGTSSSGGSGSSAGGGSEPDGDSGSAAGAASSAGKTGGSTSGAASGSAAGAAGRGTGTPGDAGGAGGSASGRRSGSSNASSGATAGRHVTDRRPHASDSGPTRTSRGGGRGSSDARQRTAGAHGSATETGPAGVVDWLRWFWTTDRGPAVYVRDVVTSVAAVLLVGLVLFGVSGVWPPMVAVESGSMEPNMQVGDLVFIIDNERYTPDEAQEYDGGTTGVVPADRATETGRSKFGGPGDVIVFRPNGNDATTPVIHRAMLWVEEGEDWYDRADADAIGTAENCEQLNHCPAPHDGFITRGDANPRYDQQTTLSEPVRPEWIVGTAELRIPFLGHIRLAFSGQIAPALDSGSAGPAGPDSTVAAAPSDAGGVADDRSSVDSSTGARIAADPATSSTRVGAAPSSRAVA